MAKEKNQGIFLTQRNLFPWKRPPKEGYCESSTRYNAQTELIEFFGMEILDQNIKGYRVCATAAKHLARVILFDRSRGVNGVIEPGDKIYGTPKKKIIFEGNITIYNKGQIPGTELEGFNLESRGKIWLAKPCIFEYAYSRGLSNVIFGRAATEKGKESRIKAIINGHEKIKMTEERRRSDREHPYWQIDKSQISEKFLRKFGERLPSA